MFSCLPSTAALDDAMQGPDGLIQSARSGQIVVELGSHPVPDKRRQIDPFKQKGAIFVDGEVSGTPGMVSARKGVIYLAGDAGACKQARASHRRLCRLQPLSRRVRRREPRQAGQQPPGRDQHRRHRGGDGARAESRCRCADMIKAIATGSGGSTQFGIRAPWMAERRFQPVQGPVPALQHYFDMIGDFADSVGVATPILDASCRSISALWTWVSAATTSPGWSTSWARCRARRVTLPLGMVRTPPPPPQGGGE